MNQQFSNMNIGRGGGRGGNQGGRGGYQGGRGGYQGGADRGGRGGGRGGYGGAPSRPIIENPKVVVNVFPIEVTKNCPVYKYDVKIELTKEERNFRKNLACDRFESARQKCVAVMAYYCQKKGYPAMPLYNRAACIYSMKKDLQNSETFDGTEVPGADLGDCKVTVTVSPAESFQTSTNDLASCVNLRPGHQPNLLEFLNLVVEKMAFSKPNIWFSENATHYLQQNEGSQSLGCGMLLKPGAKTSVKVYGKDLMHLTLALAVDIKCGVFHKEQPLLEKYNEVTRMGLGGQEILRGLSVTTTYGERKQVFSIQRVSGNARETTIVVNEDKGAVKMSVLDYFQKIKKIPLKHADKPLVWRRRGDQWSMFPMELLNVLPNQSVRVEKMGGEIQEATIKFSAMPPQVRLNMCKDYMRRLRLTPTNPELLNFGVKLGENFMEIVAKTLHAVKVQDCAPQNNVSYRVGRFALMPKLTRWAIINLGAREETFNEFLTFFQTCMKDKGIQSDAPVVIRNSGGLTAKQTLDKAKEKGLRFIFVVMDDKSNGHDEMKYYELKNQVVTQIIKSSNAFKIVRVTMDNILLKLCLKNGGVPYNVESGSGTFKIATNDIMYIGLEFSHQQPKSGMDMSAKNSSKLPSRVGFAATCGTDARQVLGDFLYIEPHNNEAVFGNMAEIGRRSIEAFKKNRKALPKTVVMYVTGFSEGQWVSLDKEFKASAKKGLPQGTHLILIAVSKAHVERFYKTVIEGNNAREQNVSAGLLIENDVVSPAAPEFFLHPHTVLQGTAKTPKYSVLLNESKTEMLAIQQATHALCFLHSVCTSAVSVPAVLTVADRCAERGQTILRYHTKANGIESISVDEANRVLTNPLGGLLATLRYNA